ncbi:MAG: acetate--CoA ligase family protein [Anaerolineaceae bacterium]|nr:acetate--CoA ligase family protein [Anaerolineaceae bacterium]
MDSDILNGLFRPKSVAVVGASSQAGKIGHTVVDNLLKSNYKGKIYPINPKADEILGLKVYTSIKDVPGPVDAAAITIPAKYVKAAVIECGEKGVKGLMIISSGFSEVGEIELENEIVEIAHSFGMRVLGPNIVGVLSNSDSLNASFAPFLPLPGKSSLVSQSGALLIAMDASTYTRRIGFDKLISIGNMSDVSFADTVEWLDSDENTSCISLYVEGLKEGRRFMEISKKAHKPIIALKSGVSEHGAAAAASHTGSLAGAAKVYGSAFFQAGVVEASDLDNLFDRGLALSLQPPLKGDNLLILTNGGGVGVLATDAAEKNGLPLHFAPAELQTELKKHMPSFGSAKNPVDITGMASTDWYVDSFKAAFAHPWVDGVVILFCETATSDPQGIAEGIKQAVIDSGIKDKPVAISYVGGERSDSAMRWLSENGIPAYGAPDVALNVMAALRESALMKEYSAEKIIPAKNIQRDKALKIINDARADGRENLTEVEAKSIFDAYGLPVTNHRLARDEAEAVKYAEEIGYPIVMKIVSPDILHKSDAGGVKVNIKDADGIREAYKTITGNCKSYKPDADVHGVLIQEMAPWGTEVIIGSVNDATFGPTVMFGLGGIFVEVLKDVTFRVAPIAKGQAHRMFGEIKGAPILAGVRGESPRDQDRLAEILSLYSQMVLDLEEEISETDANPVLVYEEGAGLKVVDARIILKAK